MSSIYAGARTSLIRPIEKDQDGGIDVDVQIYEGRSYAVSGNLLGLPSFPPQYNGFFLHDINVD